MANIRFQNALNGIAQPTPPVWFMRQAGRYHKHYRALKEKYTFMQLCKEPDLAARVALGPIQEFDFDVSILFSDLLFPLEALGMGLTYDPGPVLGWHLSRERINSLRSLDESLPHLQFQAQALKATRELLPKDKSLIGFIGGPWTLYVYAVEGGHSGSLAKAKSQPELYQEFCQKLVPLLEANIDLQLKAGAEVVMLFDTAAGELSPLGFRRLILPFLDRLASKFPQKLGYYSKGTQEAHLDDPFFSQGLLAGIGVDHRWNLSQTLAGHKRGFLQGNFDQSLLFLDAIEFERECRRYFEPLCYLSGQERAPWVAALGHGVLPNTPEENVRRLVNLTREIFR